jgi:uncharacterized protein
MKYLLVLIVVVLGLWLLLRARPSTRADRPPAAKKKGPSGPAAMVACAHCDLRLPQSEAQFDAQGRPFCSEAHRLAGPR